MPRPGTISRHHPAKIISFLFAVNYGAYYQISYSSSDLHGLTFVHYVVNDHSVVSPSNVDCTRYAW